MSFGPLEIVVILFVLAMIVGPSRISRVARSLGKGAYDFIDELGSGKKDHSDDPSGELEPGDEREEERNR
jgi:Sec-independent protein translocase protein TatA